ncbi:hypothetical protein Tco_0117366 [Tanacetum coccineum]
MSAAKVVEDSSILISTGSEGFVDRVVETCSYKQLLVVHDSLFVLACIKEKYDKVKCWQGELIYVPEKWAPFDVVFLYFVPGLPFDLGQVFGALCKNLGGLAASGEILLFSFVDMQVSARIVISHPKGREILKQQKAEHPDAVVADLPDKTAGSGVLHLITR